MALTVGDRLGHCDVTALLVGTFDGHRPSDSA